MRTASLLVTIATLATPPAAIAQVAYDSPAGRVVILGLERWSVAQLEQAIQKERPGLALHDAACEAVMRNSLGFADASVVFRTIVDHDGSQKQYVVIKAVEPQDSARVQWRRAPGDGFGSLRPDYAPVVLPVTDSGGGFWMGRLQDPMQFYPRGAAARAAAAEARPAMREDAERLWRWLDTRIAERDNRTALQALTADGLYVNRVIAAMVLANFADRDETWHALVEALRDPHPHVRGIASAILSNLPAERQVDWTPVLPSLRLLLGGTNVEATETVMSVLAETHIDPVHGVRLLRDNTGWVRAHLRAEDPGASWSARALLRQLNAGRAFGSDPDAWDGFLSGR